MSSGPFLSEHCSNCGFHKNFSSTNVECHRLPPTVTATSTFGYGANWPMPDKNSWCGEWKAEK